MTGVTGAAAVRVSVPLRRPLVTARGTWRSVDAWLVRLTDASGRPGLGEATLGPDADPADLAQLDGLVRSLVTDPGQVAGLVSDDEPAGRATREPAPAEAALGAALATAWLDLGHEPAGRPRATSVAVNAMIGAESLHASVAAARTAVADGFTTLKVKGGGEASTSELVDRLLAVRAAVGPDVRLRLDVNGTWDEAVAEERLSALRPIGLELVEQPVAVGDGAAAAMARLRARTGMPVGADESVTSVVAARRLLDVGAVDVLVVKPARVGGPRAALAIAELAVGAGVGVVISTLLETGVGLQAALVTAALLPPGGPPLAHGLATGPLLATDLLRCTAAAGASSASRATCPVAPGLGLVLDEAAVARHTIERLGAWV